MLLASWPSGQQVKKRVVIEIRPCRKVGPLFFILEGILNMLWKFIPIWLRKGDYSGLLG